MELQKPVKFTRMPSSFHSSAHSSSHDTKKARKSFQPPAHRRGIPATLFLLFTLTGVVLLSLYFTLSLVHLIVIWLSLAVLYLLFKKTRSFLIEPRHRPISSVQWHMGYDYNKNRDKVSQNGSCLKSNIVREGTKLYNNGDFYEGEFYEGRVNGSGVLFNSVGEGTYEGDWVDGKCNGYGIEKWTIGSWYIGQFRDGVRHGLGNCRFFNGDMYSGEMVNGMYSGRGVQSSADGSYYTGQFKAGAKHGVGCYYFR